MTNRLEMNRRQFVVTTAVVGGGMAIGFGPPAGLGQALAAEGDVEFSAWFTIGADDTITVRVPSSNSGVGGHTSAPMIVCEELHCDWTKVRTEPFPPTRNVLEKGVYTAAFGNAKAVGRERDKLLRAGASGRERLKAAAAQQWGVPVSEIDTKDSKLIHKPTGRTLRYGEVAAKAAAIKLDAEPKIKPMNEWTFLGKPQPQLETRGMVNGSAIFGIDVKIPGMLYAAVKACPVIGGKLKSFDANAIKDRPGVVKVVALGGPGSDKSTVDTRESRLEAAVAVVADHYWTAKSALDILPVEWDEGPAGKLSSEDFHRAFTAKLNEPGAEAKNIGDVVAAMKTAEKIIEAVYETPYIDHAVMEPFNATVQVRPDRVEVWNGVQDTIKALTVVAEESGVAPGKVFINQTLAGGSFGRRSKSDEIRQAIAIAMQVGDGRPVQLIWSREETMRHNHMRPLAISKFQCGLNKEGWPVAWFNRHVSHSTGQQYNPDAFKGLDASALRNLSVDNEYSIPNTRVEYTAMQTNILTGSWRGPGGNQTLFMLECFMDEVALAGGKDPVELRRWLLRDAKDKGWLQVLNEVATKAQWGKPLPKGRAQGIAIGTDHGTIIAEVAEVSVSRGGEVKVHSVDAAFDLGHVLNPDGVRNQVEGGIVMGVSATLNEEITVKNGRVVQGNFDDYPLLRIVDSPVVRTHFGGNTGGSKLTPIGEPPTVILPPAVCNAIFRACGKRVRTLPVRNHDLSWS